MVDKNLIEQALKLLVKKTIDDNEELYKWLYFVVFYTLIDLRLVTYHIVGYKEIPNEESILHNLKELETDEDFALSTSILKNIQYKVIKI